MSRVNNDPTYMRAARARYEEKHKRTPEAHLCACGNPAAKRKMGCWICSRCDDIEARLDSDFHQSAWDLKPSNDRRWARRRLGGEVGPFDPAFYGHRIGGLT